jgi:SAM-dependent methyltransferase
MKSTLKKTANRLLGMLGLEIRRIPIAADEAERRRRLAESWRQGPQIPWTSGYLEAKEELIRNAITNDDLLRRFQDDTDLPEGFGFAIDERCVEYPWLLARLNERPSVNLLDCGSTLNHAYILDQPRFKTTPVQFLTLAPEPQAFWQRGHSYLYGDMRDIPLRNDLHDTIVCVSTLEHVGMDNHIFTGVEEPPTEAARFEFLRAFAEMARVLKPGGQLHITVPYGRYENHGSFQQFDAELLEKLADAWNAPPLESTFFLYGDAGWKRAEQNMCDDVQYAPWIMTPAHQRPDTPTCENDHSAAARSVACLTFQKPTNSAHSQP